METTINTPFPPAFFPANLPSYSPNFTSPSLPSFSEFSRDLASPATPTGPAVTPTGPAVTPTGPAVTPTGPAVTLTGPAILIKPLTTGQAADQVTNGPSGAAAGPVETAVFHWPIPEPLPPAWPLSTPQAPEFQALPTPPSIRTPLVRPLYLPSGRRRPLSGPDRKKKAPELSRDDRIRVQTLHNAHIPYRQIASQLNITINQVKYAIKQPQTPRKNRCGRREMVRTPQRNQLKEWLLADYTRRFLSWRDLPSELPYPLNQYSENALRTAYKLLGIRRVTRPRRIELTQEHMRKRREFAELYLRLRPRPEDWINVIFSDETYAVNDPMWKQYVSIFPEESFENFFLKKRRPHGWMFWGQFAGSLKGETYFWEKGEGGVSSEKYITYILPLVKSFYDSLPPDHLFQQDNAPSHSSARTLEAIERLNIHKIDWPPRSPDLNPMENVWSYLKAWMEKNYDIQSLNPLQLRQAVITAWENIPENYLLRLAYSMPTRLRKVLENNGDRIKY